MTASERWADALAAWAIPEEILAQAPASPWGFPSEVFVDATRTALAEPATPTHRRAAEALPPGGALLDVGCGAGAASLPVAPPAGRIVAVDQDPAMLRAIAELGRDRATIDVVEGRWPDVAEQVGVVDVAVCANVAYNVADLGPFFAALTEVSRHRVVLELTDVHPQEPLSPLWRHFWGLERPGGPTADDAIELIGEVTGAAVEAERWERTRHVMAAGGQERLAWMRRRLCLTEDADAELAQQLERMPALAPTAVVTLWWPGQA
jgi:SAM-dependent methyltransferase